MGQTGEPEVLSAQGRHNLLSVCGLVLELALRRRTEHPVTPLHPDTSADSTTADSGAHLGGAQGSPGWGVVSEG